MWVSRQTYERLWDTIYELEKSLDSSEDIRETYAEQNKVLQVNLDWLRTRVNQLEHERAQLLWNYTGVKVAVPQIHVEETTGTHPLAEMPSFNDIGDAEAKRQGIEWDSEGRVVYSK